MAAVRVPRAGLAAWPRGGRGGAQGRASGPLWRRRADVPPGPRLARPPSVSPALSQEERPRGAGTLGHLPEVKPSASGRASFAGDARAQRGGRLGCPRRPLGWAWTTGASP